MTAIVSPTLFLGFTKNTFNMSAPTATTTTTAATTTASTSTLRPYACVISHQYDSLKVLYIVSMVCVLMLSLVGNSIVILAVVKSQVLNSRATFRFAASLAASDMIMALSQIPLRILYAIHDRHFCYSLTLCYVRQFTDYVGGIASILNLFFISLDRFVAIEYPLRYLQEVTNRRCTAALLFIWTVAVTWATSGMFPWKGSHGVTVNRRCYNADRLFLYVSYFGLYAPILFVVTCFYAEILRVAIGQIRRLERISSARRPSSPQPRTPIKRKESHFRKEMKTTYSIFIVYLTFCMCWLPSAVILLIQLVDMEHFKYMLRNNYTVLWFAVSDICPAIITSINPIIYSFSNHKFRNGVRSIWNREMRRSSNSSSRLVSSVTQRWLRSRVSLGSTSSANNSPIMLKNSRTGSYKPAHL